MFGIDHILLVPEDHDGDRLDRVITDALGHFSREYIQRLIREGQVWVNDVCIKKPAHTLTEADCLTIHIPELKPLQLASENLDIPILFEDDTCLIVNKPSGMLTHPNGQHQTGTLVNALLYHCQGKLSGINGIERPGIVHRLDRDTSGLLMIAKTNTAHQQLQQQIQQRVAKRQYRTIVQGTFGQASGQVNAPIGRHPKQRDKMQVSESGRTACTEWLVIETIGSNYTHLELTLHTGRTHQIRVHMAHIGHPIVADPMYGTGLENQLRLPLSGQVLQAFQLSFLHPLTQEPLSFTLEPDTKFIAAHDQLSQR